MLLSGFLAARAEARRREQQGAWSGAGSRPVPSQACQVGCDCSSQTAPCPQHGTAMALPPHVCSKRTSSYGKTCLQTSQAGTDLAIGGFQIWDSNKVSGLKRQAGRMQVDLLWGGFRLTMKKQSTRSKEGPAQSAKTAQG